MKALKPDIVYLSMAGLGHAGRNREYKRKAATFRRCPG